MPYEITSVIDRNVLKQWIVSECEPALVDRTADRDDLVHVLPQSEMEKAFFQ